MAFHTDAGADLEQLAEEDADRRASRRRFLDSAKCGPQAIELCGGRSGGTGGSGNAGDGDSASSNSEGGSPTPLKYCEKLPDQCGGKEGGDNTEGVLDAIVGFLENKGIVGVGSFGASGFAGFGATGGLDYVLSPDLKRQSYDFGGAGVGLGNFFGLHGGASAEFGIGFNIHNRNDYLETFSVVQFSLPGYSVSVAWAGDADDPITFTVGPSIGSVGVSYTEPYYVYH